MEAIKPKVLPSQSFTGYKVNKAGDYLLKKTNYQLVDTFSFITALTSMTGFTVGGVGLLSDYLQGKDGNKKVVKKNFAPQQQKQIPVYKDFEASNTNFNGKEKDKTQEGAKTIVPSTKFSKLALKFAKVGIAFSGIAGVFNGISMGLPLMAAGEALNVCSSPIIETPLGTGIFGIALAAVFSGRALENDPSLKMDKIKLSQQQGLKNKAAYVLENMKDCAKEVLRTTKMIGTNFIDLFKSENKKEAINFFKEIVAVKPKKIVVNEHVNRFGKTILETGFKSNPCLMHSAALVLAIGGATLAISSVIKNKLGQKIGLRAYETGGSFDNLGLSRWGMEKAAMASTPSARLAGNMLGLSGLTILAGQPGVDEKWGRGTQWVGTGLLFAVFAVERLPKAFKPLKASGELKTLIRQWEIDLTKLYSDSQLKQKVLGKQSLLDCIIKYVKNESDGLAGKIKNQKEQAEFNQILKVLEQSDFKKILDTAKTELTKGAFNNDKSAVNKTIKDSLVKANPELKERLDDSFHQFGRIGDFKEITNSLQKESDKIFQAA